MKSKRILTALLTVFMILCLVGCGEAKTSHAVGTNLNKSMTNLSSIVKNIEEINYNEIIIEDISPLSDNTFNTVSNTSALQKTKWYRVGGNVSSTIETKPKSNNAKYVNSEKFNKNKIGLDAFKTKNLAQKTTRNTTQKTAQRTTQNSNCYGDNCNTTANNNTTANRTSYKPRYVNQVSESFNRNSLDSYIGKIEVLYNRCADCISCEAECKNEKNILNQKIEECKVLCQKLKDGTIKLTDNEITSCNDCISNISSCADRLKTTKGNIGSKSHAISKIKNNYNTNISGIEDAYQKLLDALETRLECYKNCNSSIDSVCNIINKTNVNMNEAILNKSNEKDIDPEFSQNTEYNANNFNKTQMQNPSRTLIPEETTDNHSAWNQGNNVNTNKNIPQYRHLTKDIKDEDHKDIISQKNQNNTVQNRPIRQNNANNNGNLTSNNGINNGALYGNNGINNGVVYNNGYNQNGIYSNNNPYPPRNIDTYHNIYKNIDTYRPNYPVQNNNILNTQNTNTNQNTEIPTQQTETQNNVLTLKNNKDITNTKNINSSIDKNIAVPRKIKITNNNLPIEKNNNIANPIDEKTNNVNDSVIEKNAAKLNNLENQDKEVISENTEVLSPLPNPYDETKIKEQKNKMIDETNNNLQKNTTMQNSETSENTEQNTTMQTIQSDGKLNINEIIPSEEKQPENNQVFDDSQKPMTLEIKPEDINPEDVIDLGERSQVLQKIHA